MIYYINFYFTYIKHFFIIIIIGIILSQNLRFYIIINIILEKLIIKYQII